MKYALLLLGIGLITSCHEYQNSARHQLLYEQQHAEPSVTILAAHCECTESADADVLAGTLHIPTGLKPVLEPALNRAYLSNTLILVGNFPRDLLDVTAFFYEPMKFRLTGKVIGYNDNNAIGKLPVFYVKRWSGVPLDSLKK